MLSGCREVKKVSNSFLPLFKDDSREFFGFVTDGQFFKFIYYDLLASLCYLPHLKQYYYSLNSRALSVYREGYIFH